MSIPVEEFIKLAHTKFNNKYDYSLVEYSSTRDKIAIICPIHGKFTSSVDSHLRSKVGCLWCAGKGKHTTETFIKKAKEIHGDKYDYSLVDYTGNKNKVKIICPDHGIFMQTPNGHLTGYGCSKCGDYEISTVLLSNRSEFIKKAKEIHGDKYDYSLVDYTGNKNKVKIICPDHGEFEQMPNSHLMGHGCGKCGNQHSSSHEYIKSYLSKHGIKFVENDRNVINPLELDFYLPDYKIAIECNGIYWHSELRGKDKNYHLNKTNLCESVGVRLIHINENEFIYKLGIVKSKLNSILGINKRRIHGRKCVVKEIDPKTKSKFMSKYHLQGNDKASVKLGLFYNDRLVSVMTFCKRRVAMGKKTSEEGEFELSRFCGNFNFTVMGGASKLLKHFERNYAPSKIVTYADKRWSQGDVYHKLGFTHTHDSKPNYWYFNDRTNRYVLYHRFKFRKSELVRLLNNYDPNVSEWENMKKNNWNRIWDCGNMVFETIIKENGISNVKTT